MDSTANILQFCRLCLVKDGVNIPIFDEQGDIRQIYLKISSCLPVKVAREDHLPKKICDGCSNKLDICYDFWRTSAESEKQLLAWLGATGKDAAQVNVKEEDNFDEPLASDISKNDDDENKCYMFEQKVEEGPPVEINDEPPPSKRPRRTAAVKAAIAMDQNSDDDGDSGEPITKMEDDSDETDGDDREPAFVDVPSTSADDQPGPSGVSKDGSDAPPVQFQNFYKRCCGLGFRSAKSYARHQESHDSGEVGCPTCGKVFMSIHSLKSHIACVHYKPHICEMCERQFRHRSKLEIHIKSFHYNEPKPHQCQLCDKSYNKNVQLVEHVKVVHEGLRYPCIICGKTFAYQAKWRQHIKTHSEDYVRKTYICELCSTVFESRHGYRHHMAKHQNKTQVICDTCGHVASDIFNLRIHIRRHHSSKESFECNICAKVFATEAGLRLHSKIHTEAKPEPETSD